MEYTPDHWAPGILADWQIEELGPILPFQAVSQRDFGMSWGLSYAGYDVRVAEDFWLSPGEFALASTVEMFRMPKDVVAFVHDKSSLARHAIAVQNTVLEPNWRGTLTLELTNHGNSPLIVRKDDPHAVYKLSETVHFRKGMPVAQIIFHKMSARPRRSYEGKYQDQPPLPQFAIHEGDAQLQINPPGVFFPTV